MIPADVSPFAPPLPPARARALPWISVVAGSLLTALPVVATVTLLPPFGLLMLLAWRLLHRYSLRRWAAAPLGLADDLVSGQPLGSAVLLWSLCFLLIEVMEQRLVFRDFWQDWLVAGALVAFVLLGGRLLAVPFPAPGDPAIVAQVMAAVLLFPAAMRVAAWIDAKRAGS